MTEYEHKYRKVFVDILRQGEEERRLAQAAGGASDAAFAQVRDNPDVPSMTALELGDFVLVRSTLTEQRASFNELCRRQQRAPRYQTKAPDPL